MNQTFNWTFEEVIRESLEWVDTKQKKRPSKKLEFARNELERAYDLLDIDEAENNVYSNKNISLEDFIATADYNDMYMLVYEATRSTQYWNLEILIEHAANALYELAGK